MRKPLHLLGGQIIRIEHDSDGIAPIGRRGEHIDLFERFHGNNAKRWRPGSIVVYGRTMTDDSQALTVEELKASFFYGSRSDLNFKFLKDLSDDDFGTFLSELLDAVSQATDGDSADEIVDVAHRWQVEAYSGHLGDPEDFPHRKDDTPLTVLPKPLSESRLLLITSSGHFVDGDDPQTARC